MENSNNSVAISNKIELVSPEVWRALPTYPDYEASSLGRIRRVKRAHNAHPGIRKQNLTRFGYFSITLNQNGKKRCHNVHRLIALAFLGMPPSKDLDACHNDGNKLNNVPSNLRWDTRKKNTNDKYLHGTAWNTDRGTDHWKAKLNEELVRAMRVDRARGEKIPSIAAKYGIAKLTAYDAITGKTWRHV